MHGHKYIASADKFLVDVKLGNRWPFRVLLYSCAKDLLAYKYVAEYMTYLLSSPGPLRR